MSFTVEETRFMARALRLARRGLYTADPNPRVGCVIVQGDRIVGEGWHQYAGQAHAEVVALDDAGDQAHGATVYVTLEPCCHHGRTPPCTGTLAAAGVSRVVAAMLDPSPQMSGQSLQQLNDAGIETAVGLLEEEAKALNPGFVHRLQHGRPLVRVKQAVSLDGRTALANGESKWITGEAARADVQCWRARSSAVLTGIGTVLADDPLLNVRDIDINRQPLRVVVDNHLSLSPEAMLFSIDHPVLVATSSEDAELADSLYQVGAEVICLPCSNGGVDLEGLMSHLAAREVNEILVEAGSVLCGALLKAGLVDELLIYVAPHLMGDSARGMFHVPALEAMADRIGLSLVDTRAVGNDWRIHAAVNK